ncbi:MAG: Ig-like domain-containing protein, partial [Oscillospiraceae bacterium]|nr:Ig-like domain-containing protein [Oscillospiraceae bacterium]
ITANRITIQYVSTGHTSGTVPSSHFVYTPGVEQLRHHNMTKTGHTFAGWRASTDNIVYLPGRDITFNGSGTITFTAVWQPVNPPTPTLTILPTTNWTIPAAGGTRDVQAWTNQPRVIVRRPTWMNPTVFITPSSGANQAFRLSAPANNTGATRTGTIEVIATDTDRTFELIRSFTVSQAASASNNIPVTGVAVHPASVNLQVNQTRTLTATVLPINATNRFVTWTSSNNLVATVDNNGVVTARSNGTAIITVRAGNGQFSDTSIINVTHPHNTDRRVSIRMYYHQTFRNEFPGNYASTANAIIANSGRAFAHQFNIHLITHTGQNIPITATMHMDLCPHGHSSQCGPHCGFPLHTDGTRNINDFHNSIFSRQTDLGIAAVSAELTCHRLNNGTVWGMGHVSWRTSLNDFRATVPPNYLNIPNADTYNVRLLQHELSHNFGVPDHNCVPGEPCVMRLNFFDNPNFNTPNIWCSRCAGIIRNNRNIQWP